MIERYTRPQMAAIWNDPFKFDTFLKIEILNAEALAVKGLVAKSDLKRIQENATYDLQRLKELEFETKHDIIAFTRAVSESLGAEKRYIHYGLTSTDVVDTANGYILKQANDIIKADLIRFASVLKDKAMLYKNTFCIGRTHGIHADITTFGLKWALWYDEMQRNIRRFNDACKDVECGKISGAVGNYAFTDPFVEDYIIGKLGIGKVNISTQTLQRDRHAFYLSVIALIGSSLEKIATEIRLLQRTEVREVSEFFDLGQKGSSAMPHKQNPIVSENITGLARILRGYVIPGFEDVTLWHERDISHSSVERVILPDATTLLDFMLHRYTNTLEKLIVYPEQMLSNIFITKGVVFSQRVLTTLIDSGLSRETAYDTVQQLALRSYRENIDFKQLVSEDTLILSKMTQPMIDGLFELDYYQRNVDYIYKQVFSTGVLT
jgi:adenylosuccinate lyase